MVILDYCWQSCQARFLIILVAILAHNRLSFLLGNDNIVVMKCDNCSIKKIIAIILNLKIYSAQKCWHLRKLCKPFDNIC